MKRWVLVIALLGGCFDEERAIERAVEQALDMGSEQPPRCNRSEDYLLCDIWVRNGEVWAFRCDEDRCVCESVLDLAKAMSGEMQSGRCP